MFEHFKFCTKLAVLSKTVTEAKMLLLDNAPLSSGVTVCHLDLKAGFVSWTTCWTPTESPGWSVFEAGSHCAMTSRKDRRFRNQTLCRLRENSPNGR